MKRPPAPARPAGGRRRGVAILGCTGSIGLSALEVVRENPCEFRVAALAARSNDERVAGQAVEFRAEAACLADPAAAERLRRRRIPGLRVFSGAEGLRRIACWNSAEVVLAASSGSSALEPVLRAIREGKDVALANKEILVAAGGIVMRAVQKNGVRFLPVDSEHNAIFQCLNGERRADIRRIILTGSGGPLKNVPAVDFGRVTPETAVNHPKWSMGRKISVDSATLMNKGLEMIEAQWLFGVGPDRIRIMIHPEAVVHSMVEFVDGSVIAQMGPTDMKSPLRHALAFPKRLPAPARIDLARVGTLHFEEPDFGKFPCLELAARAAARCETTLPCVLSAADEIAVDAFLNGRIDFMGIPAVIEKVMDAHRPVARPRLADIRAADQWARAQAAGFLPARGRLCRVS